MHLIIIKIIIKYSYFIYPNTQIISSIPPTRNTQTMVYIPTTTNTQSMTYIPSTENIITIPDASSEQASTVHEQNLLTQAWKICEKDMLY